MAILARSFTPNRRSKLHTPFLDPLNFNHALNILFTVFDWMGPSLSYLYNQIIVILIFLV